MSIIGQVTYQTRMFETLPDVGDVSNLFESKVAAVTNFPFEGHCAMTNADEANEVQENVVTAKKGKKAKYKSYYLIPGK